MTYQIVGNLFNERSEMSGLFLSLYFPIYCLYATFCFWAEEIRLVLVLLGDTDGYDRRGPGPHMHYLYSVQYMSSCILLSCYNRTLYSQVDLTSSQCLAL